MFVSSPDTTATFVDNRTDTISGSCKPDNSTNMINFDTDSNLFYYDSANQKSDVSIMLNANDVPEFVLKHAGAGNFELLIKYCDPDFYALLDPLLPGQPGNG